MGKKSKKNRAKKQKAAEIRSAVNLTASSDAANAKVNDIPEIQVIPDILKVYAAVAKEAVEAAKAAEAGPSDEEQTKETKTELVTVAEEAPSKSEPETATEPAAAPESEEKPKETTAEPDETPAQTEKGETVTPKVEKNEEKAATPPVNGSREIDVSSQPKTNSVPSLTEPANGEVAPKQQNDCCACIIS